MMILEKEPLDQIANSDANPNQIAIVLWTINNQ